MSQILVSGIITLDIIHYHTHYPEEDSEQRANQQIFEIGGNATNSSYILKQLGHEPKLATTLAAEKDNAGIDDLFQYADVLFFSKNFAQQRGFQQADACLRYFGERYTDKTLICAWEEHGAWKQKNHTLVSSPAYPPQQVIDVISLTRHALMACSNNNPYRNTARCL